MPAGPHGSKHVCFQCSCKFYDLNRPKVVCPRCGADQAEAPEQPNIVDIAAKVMASSVTDSDEPSERYGPVADEMEVFDSDEVDDSSDGEDEGDEDVGDDEMDYDEDGDEGEDEDEDT